MGEILFDLSRTGRMALWVMSFSSVFQARWILPCWLQGLLMVIAGYYLKVAVSMVVSINPVGRLITKPSL